MFDPATMSQGLDVPARNLPVPGTPSPQIQRLIGAPFRPDWNVLPKSAQEWQQVVEARAAATLKTLPGLIERMKVKVEKTIIDGVRALVVTPESILPNNRHRVLIHMHGGCYVFNPGDAGLPEAVMMAGLGGFRVISVDYRMPPESHFPAALDDGITVYQHLLRTTDPKRLAIFGTSAGGALTLAIVLRAKQEGIPVPAVIASGTPMSDVTGVGDTFFTNELVDNVLVSRNGICQAAAQYYAAGHDMKDPFLSPVYGDMAGFPPTILTSGTRDMLLSNTVRVHRKMRQAGVEAYLQIFEGQSHAHYLFEDSAPESKEAFAEISDFFDKHMAK
jgi:epsilon-lactone hydrolase